MNPLKKLKLKSQLRNCDYMLAGTVIKQQYYDANKSTVINRLIDDYMADPGFDNALKLIEYNDMMVFYFTESCAGGLYIRKQEPYKTGTSAPNEPDREPETAAQEQKPEKKSQILEESEAWMEQMIASSARKQSSAPTPKKKTYESRFEDSPEETAYTDELAYTAEDLDQTIEMSALRERHYGPMIEAVGEPSRVPAADAAAHIPSPEPLIDAADESSAQPAGGQATDEPASEPFAFAQPAVEPATEPAPEPAKEAAAELFAQPAAEPASKGEPALAPEPTAEAATPAPALTKPAAEPADNALTEPAGGKAEPARTDEPATAKPATRSYANVIATLQIDIHTMTKQLDEYRHELSHYPWNEKQLIAWIKALEDAIEEFSAAVDVLEDGR